MSDNWKDNITPEDMPNDEMRLVAQLCGVETAKRLIENVSGINIYIPSQKFCYRHLMKRYVQRNYNGRNARTLAVHLGVSQHLIYDLLNEKMEKETKKIQIGLEL